MEHKESKKRKGVCIMLKAVGKMMNFVGQVARVFVILAMIFFVGGAVVEGLLTQESRQSSTVEEKSL